MKIQFQNHLARLAGRELQSYVLSYILRIVAFKFPALYERETHSPNW